MKWQFMFLFAVMLTSCKQGSVDHARELVERYNRVVSEAYRRGDVKLIDAVVAPNSSDGKNITGLIGVRLDMGLTLDAHLLSLEITSVEQSKGNIRVGTKERWQYRNFKIGTGEQVGEESVDSFEMIYVFKNLNKAWLVEEISFAAPPQIGRTPTIFADDPGALHGASMPGAKERNQ